MVVYWVGCVDQVVYPEILPLTADFQALDAELMKILRTVHLGHLLLPEAKQQQTLVFPVAPGIESTGSIASTGKQHSSEGDPQHGEDKAEVVGKAEAEKRVEVEQSVRGRQLYSLDSVVNWGEVLSGGEKQRLSLARYFTILLLCSRSVCWLTSFFPPCCCWYHFPACCYEMTIPPFVMNIIFGLSVFQTFSAPH